MRALSLSLRFNKAGGHTHVRVFTGPDPDHRAKAGDLTFTNREWDIIATRLNDLQAGIFRDPTDMIDVQIVDETPTGESPP